MGSIMVMKTIAMLYKNMEKLDDNSKLRLLLQYLLLIYDNDNYNIKNTKITTQLNNIIQLIKAFTDQFKSYYSEFDMPLTIDPTIMEIFNLRKIPEDKNYYEKEHCKFKLIKLCNILLEFYNFLLKRNSEMSNIVLKLFNELKKIILKELFYRK